MANAKLHQVLAIEKSVKSRVSRQIQDSTKKVLRPDLFNGFSKDYSPKDDDGDMYPAERKRVQTNASDLLREAGKMLAELFNITAQKDYANCYARADVILDGDTEALLRDVPVTFLLFLEKQLTELHNFASKAPVLDPAEEWAFDSHANIFKTPATQTTKTKKVQKPIVLHPPTKEHPAQTQLIVEDAIVGHWKTVKQSGALPAPLKTALLEKIEALSKAVKFAREAANAVEAPKHEMGRAVYSYLFED